MVEHLNSDTLERSLRDYRHKPIKEERAEKSEHVKRGENQNYADDRRIGSVSSRLTIKIILNMTEHPACKQSGYRSDNRAYKDRHCNNRQKSLVILEYQLYKPYHTYYYLYSNYQ